MSLFRRNRNPYYNPNDPVVKAKRRARQHRAVWNERYELESAEKTPVDLTGSINNGGFKLKMSFHDEDVSVVLLEGPDQVLFAGNAKRNPLDEPLCELGMNLAMSRACEDAAAFYRELASRVGADHKIKIH